MKFFGKELKFNNKDIALKEHIPTTLPANGGDADTVDGKHASSFLENGDVIMNTNPFGGKQLFINNINNALFNADKRWVVTGTLYNENGSEYSKVSSLYALFNGNYEDGITIPAGKYLKVNISFNGGYFPGYPYGYIYISHYYTQWCNNAILRVYCNYEPHGIGWKEYNFSEFVKSGSNLILVAREPVYAISEMELIIYAKSDIDSRISQIDYKLDRPGTNEMPILDKFKPNKLYYHLDMNSNNVINIADPVKDTDSANKQYVDKTVPTKLSQLTNDVGFTQNALKQTVSATQPTGSKQGDVWIKLI